MNANFCHILACITMRFVTLEADSKKRLLKPATSITWKWAYLAMDVTRLEYIGCSPSAMSIQVIEI